MKIAVPVLTITATVIVIVTQILIALHKELIHLLRLPHLHRHRQEVLLQAVQVVAEYRDLRVNCKYQFN
jgi:hypothetical protein